MSEYNDFIESMALDFSAAFYDFDGPADAYIDPLCAAFGDTPDQSSVEAAIGTSAVSTLHMRLVEFPGIDVGEAEINNLIRRCIINCFGKKDTGVN